MIDKLAWIHIIEKRILSTRNKGKSTFYIPGGKREGNETDEEALLREISEELTISLIPESILFFGEFQAQAHGKSEGTFVRMRCYTAKFIGSIQASSEIEEVRWLGFVDKSISSPVDQIIFDYLKEKDMIE